MSLHPRYGILVKLFSSSLINQALLSITSLLVGSILVRRTPDLQYGFYVLAINTLLLFASLQGSFFGQPLISRLTVLDARGRGDVVGGMYRSQRFLLRIMALCAAIVALAGWAFGLLDRQTGPLTLVVIAAALATLDREYFRMVLLGFRRPQDVLRADFVYVVLLVSGVLLATLTSASALTAIIGLAVAAMVGSALLSRRLKRHEPWNMQGAPNLLREIAPVGLWSCAGAGIHWAFSQGGYGYMVAGVLGVPALAAVAATRMLMQPINLLSTGLGALMLPLTSAWLHEHGALVVMQRLMLFAAGLAVAALCYLGVLWEIRDWLFTSVLKKDFAQRDQLILLWFAAFVVMVMRDQLLYLLVARARFRNLMWLTLFAAILSLTANYFGLKHFGTYGAPLGVLAGELISVAGIIVLSVRELRLDPALRPGVNPI